MEFIVIDRDKTTKFERPLGLNIDSIYNMDCLEGMRKLQDGIIDCVVTSPPYDNLRTYDNDVDKTWGEHIWKPIIKELYRIIKQGGVVVWVVGDATINGSETGTSFRQALYFMECGFNLHDTMIWEKTGMLPTQDRYYNIFEYMFVFSKGKPSAMNFICDHKTTAGGRVQKKDLCINKGHQTDGQGTFVRNEYSRRTNIWRITIGKNKDTGGHPAPFPIDLARDHIITWSNPGDLILDPFIGSGTTAIACIKEHRHFIGFELNKEYYDKAVKRIKDEQAQPTLF